MADPISPSQQQPAGNSSFTLDLRKPQDVDKLVDMLSGQKTELGLAAVGASAIGLLHEIDPKSITPEDCSSMQTVSQSTHSSISTIGQIADLLARPDVARMTEKNAGEIKTAAQNVGLSVDKILEGPKATCQKFGA